MEKKNIRREVKQAVLALPADVREAEAEQVMKALRRLIDEHRAEVVALFSPLPDEINIFPLVASLGCRVVLPRITMSSPEESLMEFYDYSPEEICDGAFGIREPQGKRAVKADQIDLMVVPGVAFTRSGERLGRGKGYYDRYLAREGFRAFCVGVCHSCQLRESLPTEVFDKRMSIVISGE